MTQISHALARIMWSAVGGEPGATDEVVFTSAGGLASAFPVTDIAGAAIATAAVAVAELMREAGGVRQPGSDERWNSRARHGMGTR